MLKELLTYLLLSVTCPKPVLFHTLGLIIVNTDGERKKTLTFFSFLSFLFHPEELFLKVHVFSLKSNLTSTMLSALE